MLKRFRAFQEAFELKPPGQGFFADDVAARKLVGRTLEVARGARLIARLDDGEVQRDVVHPEGPFFADE